MFEKQRAVAPAGMGGQLRLLSSTRHRTSQRRQREVFRPAPESGTYRLPGSIADRLATDLAPFRNRDAALALARFIARYWSSPGRLEQAFPVDRRALARHPALGLSEGRVRGALATLERIGFLDKLDPLGSTHRLAASGELWRKAVPYQIGLDFRPQFIEANRAARARQQRQAPPVRLSTPARSVPAHRFTTSPKSREPAKPMIMGEVVKQESARTSNPLEASLDRWAQLRGRREADHCFRPEQ